MEVTRRDAMKIMGAGAATSLISMPEAKSKEIDKPVSNQEGHLSQFLEDDFLNSIASVQYHEENNINLLPYPAEELKSFTATVDGKKLDLNPMVMSKYQVARNLINQILENEEVKTIKWDFNIAHGDTIKEKYEDLWRFCNKHHVTFNNGWMITSPEISSIFETVNKGFEPIYETSKVDSRIILVGKIHNWLLYKADYFPITKALMGHTKDVHPGLEKFNMFRTGSVISIARSYPDLSNADMLVYGQKIVNPHGYKVLDIDNYIL